MIRKENERIIHHREHLFGGNGAFTVCDLLNGPEEMNDKGRVFAHTTLNPGSSIGFHVHENDSETYYILRGEALYNDNGTETVLTAGDVAITPAGSGHAIANHTSEPVEFIALILYK